MKNDTGNINNYFDKIIEFISVKSDAKKLKKNKGLLLFFFGSHFFVYIYCLDLIFSFNLLNIVTAADQFDIGLVGVFLVFLSRSIVFIKLDDNSINDNLGIAANILLTALLGHVIFFRLFIVIFNHFY